MPKSIPPLNPVKLGAPIAKSPDTRPTNVRSPFEHHRPNPSRSMQGVYYRSSAKKAWELVRRTRSVADAEGVIRRLAADRTSGRLLYVEAMSLPTSVWDMRGLVHRTLGTWLVKALRTDFRKIKQSARKVWQPHNPAQMKLFG